MTSPSWRISNLKGGEHSLHTACHHPANVRWKSKEQYPRSHTTNNVPPEFGNQYCPSLAKHKQFAQKLRPVNADVKQSYWVSDNSSMCFDQRLGQTQLCDIREVNCSIHHNRDRVLVIQWWLLKLAMGMLRTEPNDQIVPAYVSRMLHTEAWLNACPYLCDTSLTIS